MGIMALVTVPPALRLQSPAGQGNVPGRLGPRWQNVLTALIGLPWQRRLARAALQIDRIRYSEAELDRLSDPELRRFGLRLAGRARGGEALGQLLPEAFGAVCVAARRTVGLRPFDVQLAAGVVLQGGAVAELATGEGKTLVAVLPAFLNALSGKGVHVTTVNDYLARRDAEWTAPIYRALGLSVGVLQGEMDDTERAQAYRADVTYGTASEFGFDYLRDRLKLQRSREPGRMDFAAPWLPGGLPDPGEGTVQRPVHHFALVDEADSVFIDEARTPLVIGGMRELLPPEEQVVYHWADSLAATLTEGTHFRLDRKRGRVELTQQGKQQARWSNPPWGPHAQAMDKLLEHVERAVHARLRYCRDQHYLVDDEGKVVIIDEYTGRRMKERHWSDGLHQAVEAKEHVPITKPSEHSAQITFQSYFRLYQKLSGMTGTAAQNGWELRRVYKVWVVCIPTNRPVIRQQWPDRVFPTEEAKFDAVVEEVACLQARGRPVLIGTRSVDRSEALSRKLSQAGIAHQVLNARQDGCEADVVAQAGQPGRVTIATNMAGRGTDIKLGLGVAEAGGLHILATERHEAVRIDRQLAGRAARQGDPGSVQFFLSLEDELLDGLGRAQAQALRRRARRGDLRSWQAYGALFRLAQRRIERRHYGERVDLMAYEKSRRELLKELAADPFVD
jgi:preprotein translocase subunit SecA